MQIANIDLHIINFFRRYSLPMARFGLFVIFFWFGSLKVAGLSPATPLVQSLFEHTIHFMSFSSFIIIFGAFEMLIGLLFVTKGFERVAIPLLAFHMVTTFMPLFFIPQSTWSSTFIPTLEGQYIIKNLVIIATAMGVAANLHPIKTKRQIINQH